jgi:hypothetical protein
VDIPYYRLSNILACDKDYSQENTIVAGGRQVNIKMRPNKNT